MNPEPTHDAAPAAVGVDADPGPPEISVVIPTHNVQDYVDELLSSVRSATGVRLEIIVVDDHSTDDTWQVLQRHAAEDARVRLLRSPGTGGGEARNAGIMQAVGEYLAFADGDDIVPGEAYAAMLAAARRTGAEIVTGSYQKFDGEWSWDGAAKFGYDVELDAVDLSRHPRLIVHRVCWNRLYRREFWLAQAITFPSVPRANDVVPVTRALLAARRISVVPVLTYRYRTRPGSMTAGQGSAAGTASYLAQEAEAARLIEQHAAPQVAGEYWGAILAQDCWRHLRAYLREDGDRADAGDAAVAAGLASLLALAPDPLPPQLSPVQHAVFILVRHRQRRPAAGLVAMTNRFGKLTRSKAATVPETVEILAAVAGTGALEPAQFTSLTEALLRPALRKAGPGITVDTCRAVFSLLRRLPPRYLATLPTLLFREVRSRIARRMAR